MNLNNNKLRSNLTDSNLCSILKTATTELQPNMDKVVQTIPFTAISLEYLQTTNVELHVGLELAQFLLSVHFSCKNLIVWKFYNVKQ